MNRGEFDPDSVTLGTEHGELSLPASTVAESDISDNCAYLDVSSTDFFEDGPGPDLEEESASLEISSSDEEEGPGTDPIIKDLGGEDEPVRAEDIGSAREYQKRLNAGSLSLFKQLYGIKPETIGEGVGFVAYHALQKYYGLFQRAKQNTWLDLSGLSKEIEFAAAGLETYLHQLQQNESGQGDGEQDQTTALEVRRVLEKSGLYEQLQAMKTFAAECRECYENNCQMDNPEQLERIFKRHLYRAHGFFINAHKRQGAEILKLKEQCQNKPERLALLDRLETDDAWKMPGSDIHLKKWAKDVVPPKYLANSSRFGRGVRKAYDGFFKYAEKPFAPVSAFTRTRPRGWVRQMWAEGIDDDLQNSAGRKARFIGYKRPEGASAERRFRPWYEFKFLADMMFPAPTIRLTGNNNGAIKFPKLSQKELEKCASRGVSTRRYRRARSGVIDFLNALTDTGRARTPGDAFSFSGNPQLVKMLKLAVKARAVATGEVFYVKNEKGEAVKITPHMENLQPEESAFLKEVQKGNAMYEDDLQHFKAFYGHAWEVDMKQAMDVTQKSFQKLYEKKPHRQPYDQDDIRAMERECANQSDAEPERPSRTNR